MNKIIMTLLWLTLLLFHEGHTLVPVVTVELGQSVSLTCDFTMKYQSNTWFYWYKQSAGDILTLIAMLQTSVSPKYGPGISSSKFTVTSNEHSSSLTIFTTVHEDEGMYHCAQMDRIKSVWNGTYISVKGIPRRTSNYTVFSQTKSIVQQSTISGPNRSTGSETLQCSVLSDHDNTTCSGEPSVFWFRAGSEKSFPDMIYTDGKRSKNCDKISDSQKKCFYSFSKNISSSDLGTYYCAVATCGQIIFGNRSNLETKGFSLGSKAIIVIFFLSAALAISLIGIVVLICSIKRNKCGYCQEAVILDQSCGQKMQQRREDRRMYSAAVFTLMKSGNTKKTAEKQMMFAAAKAFGF